MGKDYDQCEMDLLKNWLSSTVEQELVTVLEKAKAFGDLNTAQGIPYEDDGSNIRVTSSKTGIIQIIKFTSLENPVQVYISDSTTRIQATIAVSAIRKYEEDTEKRFTEGTLGGLFQILDFEIVATHLGPRPSRLTLLIKKFKSIGSNGSGTFGMPQAIEQKPEISQLLEKISVFRTLQPSGSEMQSGPDDSTRDSSIFSQVEANVSDDSAPSTSQVPFATQLARPFIKKRSKKVVLEPSTNGQPGAQSTSTGAAARITQTTSKLGVEVLVADTIPFVNNAPVKAPKGPVLDEFRQPPVSKPIVGEPNVTALKISSNASALLGLLVRNRQARANPKQDLIQKGITLGLMLKDENTTNTNLTVLPNTSTDVDDQTPLVSDDAVPPLQRFDEVREDLTTDAITSAAPKNRQPEPLIASQSTTRDPLMLSKVALSATTAALDISERGHTEKPKVERLLAVLEEVPKPQLQHSIGIDSEPLRTRNVPVAAEILPERNLSSTVESVTPTIPEMPAIPIEHLQNNGDGALEHLATVEFSDDGRKRRKISHRELAIPKYQTFLLGRSDSWLPAEPGERNPAQNVPIELLENLNRKADRPASRSNVLREKAQSVDVVDELQQSPFTVLESGHDDTQDSEAVFVSSSDWPTTPSQHNFEQLPPDSSMEIEDSTSEKTTKPRLDGSEAQAQAKAGSPSQSFADLVLATETGSRLCRPSVRTSLASQRSTTSLNPADSSTGEESTRFSCPAPGCEKTYRNRNGLKYHIERHHRNKRSHEVPDNGKMESRKNVPQNLESKTGHDAICNTHISNTESIDHEKNRSLCSTPPDSLQGGREDVRYDSGDEHQSPGKNTVLGTQDEMSESPGQVEHNPNLIAEVKYRPMKPKAATSTNPSNFPYLEHISQSQYGTQTSQSLVAQDPRSSPADLTVANENALQTPPVEDTAVLPLDSQGSTESDSEIEVEIPSVLCQNTLAAFEEQRQAYPSTTSQSDQPSLQVKRTPYSHGPTDRMSSSRTAPNAFSSNVNGLLSQELFRNAAYLECTQSSPELRSHSYQSDLSSSESGHFFMRPAIAAENEVDHGGAVTEDKRIMARQIHSIPDARHQSNRRFAVVQPEYDQDSKEQVHQAEQSQVTSTNNTDTKRKAPTTELLSPNVTKRRKHFKRPTAFDFSQDRSAVQDPIVLGRTYRREFLAYRKNSMPTSSNKPDLHPQSDRFADPFCENEGRPQTAPMSQVMSTQQTLGQEHLKTATLKGSASASVTSDSALQSFRNADAMTPISYDEAGIIQSVEEGTVGGIHSSTGNPIELQTDEDVTMKSDYTNSQPEKETAIPTAEPSHTGGVTEEDYWETGGAAALVRRLSSSTHSIVESGKSSGGLPCSKAPLSPYASETIRTETAPNSKASAEKPNLRDFEFNSPTLQSIIDRDQEGCKHTDVADIPEPAHRESCSRNTIPVDQIHQAVAGAISPEKCLFTNASKVDVRSVVPKDLQVSLSAGLSNEGPTRLRLSPQHELITSPAGIFARFKTNYLDYTGDLRHFVAICKRINTLVKVNRMIPKFLWDDFIVRHKLDYPQYLQECNDLVEDPMPYEQFYHERIAGPNYMSKVVTSSNLADILRLDKNGATDYASPGRAVPSIKSPEKGGTSFTREPFVIPSLIGEAQQSQKPFPQSTPKVTIDLTADEPEVVDPPPIISPIIVLPPHTTSRKLLPTQEPRTEPPLPRTSFTSRVSTNSGKKPRRSLPWTEARDSKAKSSSLGKSTKNGRSPLSSLTSTPSKASVSQTHEPLTNRLMPKSTFQYQHSRRSPAPISTSKPTNHTEFSNPKPQASTSPRSLRSPELDTAAETLATAPADDWYKDANTPFKDFARAYTSIQPGKGNSFAQPGVPPKERRVRKEPRKLDIWNWKLD